MIRTPAPFVVELLALPYSPWSEKARWALDARGVGYRYRTYAPLVGEPRLRLKLRRWTGTVSVPVLTDEQGRAITDSAAIARWADERGDGPRLFPGEHDAAIARFIELSERGLAAGRVLSLIRMLDDREALGEMVPRALRRSLGGRLAARVGGLGVRRTIRKYDPARTDHATHERTLAEVLDELRAALAKRPPGGAPPTLLGHFSFADVAMTQVLAFFAPPAFGLRLGKASRRSFSDPALADRYADLVTWRDAVYEAHRPRG